MTATYRLQLHAGFTFADAEATVPYLASLGVTHLYLSPVLQAASGSLHGYDVVDHSRISAGLGGRRGLESLAGTAREAGLGLVVDVVPNHMALVAPLHAAPAVWELLARGRDAETAAWFDVDWAHLDGRVGLPLLGGTVEEELAGGHLRLGVHDGRRVVTYHDHVFPVADGTPDTDDVAAVLAAQHYLLASWRQKDEVLNYRRFFDVDGLIGVRVEEPEVFEATHRLLLELNHRGVIEGFRIDHPDGLADPEGYLRRLRAATRIGTAIWVEKILEGEERLPETWECEGTTGYDALRAVTAALVDPATTPALDRAWAAAGGVPTLAPVVQQAKREVVTRLLRPELARLVRRAGEALPHLEAGRLEAAVTELLVAGEVYRAYTRPPRPAEGEALRLLRRARDRAAAARPDLAGELDALTDLAARPPAADPAAVDFAVRLQQTWGPVMAKAVEDTAFYRWHRLVALNEVGGDPALLEEAAPEVLHAWAGDQQRRHPLGMTTLSTHDTKRSEDVRARILAVAGDAESWAAGAEGFARAAERYGVDGPTGHLLWQTLVGAGDIRAERLHGYLTKAVREAKVHTAWGDGDPDYERRVLELADAALAPGPLRALVDTALAHNAAAVRSLVLGQKLLQLTLPGVPDIYQGCELVNLSLVDPDNRRPVDFEARAKRLEDLAAGQGPRDLDDEKLLVTVRALALRKQLRQCFGDAGEYAPVPATSGHVVAYRRGREVAVAVTRAARRLASAGGWAEHRLELPGGLWREELTGTLHEGGPLRCAELFESMPVALLRKVHV